MAGPNDKNRMSTEMVDLAMMEAVVRAVDKISKSVEVLTVGIDKAGKASKEGLEEAIDDNDHLDRAMKEVEQRFKKHAEAAEKEKTLLGKLATAADEYNKKLGAAATSGIKALGGGDVASFGKQMMNALPFGIGGILGFMLWGRSRDMEFAAAARRSLYVMQQVGGVASSHLGQITGQVRQMYREWGSMGQELDATMASLAEFNIAEGAFARTGTAAKGFANNVALVSTRMDLLTASQPGTTAKLIGETMMASGASVGQAADQVLRLGASLRAAGLNYTQFAQGIVQATSALRTQNQSLEDTQKVFEQLRGGFISKGVDPARAAQMALSGVQAAGGALQGMPQGLQALVAQRMAQGGAQGFAGIQDPFALLTKFRLGQEGGGDRAFMTQAFSAVRDLIVERIPAKAGQSGEETELRRIGALSRVGGMSEEAARAILRGADATNLMLSPAEKTAKFTEDLQNAFNTRASTQSAFEQAMREMQDDLAQIASDSLFVLVDIFRELGTIGTTISNFRALLPERFGGYKAGSAEALKADQELAEAQAIRDSATVDMAKRVDHITKPLTDIAHKAKRLVDITAPDLAVPKVKRPTGPPGSAAPGAIPRGGLQETEPPSALRATDEPPFAAPVGPGVTDEANLAAIAQHATGIAKEATAMHHRQKSKVPPRKGTARVATGKK